MKKIQSIVAASVISMVAISTHAEGLYGVVSVGKSQDADHAGTQSGLDSALAAAGATGISSSYDDKQTGEKLQLGYQFTPNWGVEGGYVNLGEFKYKATVTGGNMDVKIKVNGFNLGLVGTYPLNDQFSVFGKLGMIDAKVDEVVTASGIGGTASGSVSSTTWESTVGVGAAYSFSKTCGVRAEWERFNKLGDSNTTGESNVDLLSIGLVVNF